MSHKFWDTQPVPQLADPSATETGPIEQPKIDVKSEPYPLPDAFTWVTLDTTDAAQMLEMQTLMSEHYVEDAYGYFRFDYSADFIRWALQPPGTPKEWIVGVRAKASGKLVACITGVIANMMMGTSATVPTAEINFLCVHKKLRAKRLAPVLIKEVTRRVNQRGIWQAVYTAGVSLPRPLAKAQYWHRSLNFKKLCEVEFTGVPPKSTMAQQIRLLRLPESPSLGLKPMEAKHAKDVHALLHAKLAKFAFYQVFSVEEVKHLLLPRDGVIYTYVLEDANGSVTDFTSFYYLPSSVLKLPGDQKIKTVYNYYSAHSSVTSAKLAEEALIIARDLGFDVFNALDVLDNVQWLRDLKFGPGDGNLHYYAYNWQMPDLVASDLGLILV